MVPVVRGLWSAFLLGTLLAVATASGDPQTPEKPAAGPPPLPTDLVQVSSAPATLADLAWFLTQQLDLSVTVAKPLAGVRIYAVAKDPVPAAAVMERMAWLAGGKWVYQDADALEDADQADESATLNSEATDDGRPAPGWHLTVDAAEAARAQALREQHAAQRLQHFGARLRRAMYAGAYLYDALHRNSPPADLGTLLGALTELGFAPEEAWAILNSESASSALMFAGNLPGPQALAIARGDEVAVGWHEMSGVQRHIVMDHWLDSVRPHVESPEPQFLKLVGSIPGLPLPNPLPAT